MLARLLLIFFFALAYFEWIWKFFLKSKVTNINLIFKASMHNKETRSVISQLVDHSRICMQDNYINSVFNDLANWNPMACYLWGVNRSAFNRRRRWRWGEVTRPDTVTRVRAVQGREYDLEIALPLMRLWTALTTSGLNMRFCIYFICHLKSCVYFVMLWSKASQDVESATI